MLVSRSKVVSALLLCLSVFLTSAVTASKASAQASQELSKKEGIPVLIKHLPNWEAKAESAIFAASFEDLQRSVSDREVLNRLDFIPGTEAVIADYPAGKLAIVEFSTPQASEDADKKVKEFVSASWGDVGFFYRRIGNYNVFLFDGQDEAAANALFDQIKYEKVVQWLGPEPVFAPQGETEREFIVGASSLFIATVVVIVSGFGFSTIIGLLIGIFYYNLRVRRRAGMSAFSDFGGMTRLNLDGLSADLSGQKLLE